MRRNESGLVKKKANRYQEDFNQVLAFFSFFSSGLHQGQYGRFWQTFLQAQPFLEDKEAATQIGDKSLEHILAYGFHNAAFLVSFHLQEDPSKKPRTVVDILENTSINSDCLVVAVGVREDVLLVVWWWLWCGRRRCVIVYEEEVVR